MSKYSEILLSQSVTHYWPLDETSGSTALASVGGLDLTISGNVTMNVFAAVNTGYSFTGNNLSYAAAPLDTTITFQPTFGFSYSLIIKVNNTMGASGAWGIISRRSNSSANRTFAAFMQGSTGGTINFDMGNNQARWNSTFAPTQGHYYHIAFVWNPIDGRYSLYVNGDLYSTVTGQAPTIQQANAPFYVAALGANPANQLFPGVIDEVAIWNNKSLTDEEIKAQYNAAFPITRVYDGTEWKFAEKNVL